MALASLPKSFHALSDFPWVHFISQIDIQDILRGSVTVKKVNIKKYITAKIQNNKLWNKSFCICVTWLCLLRLPATATSRIYSSFTCSHNFLAKRRALNDSKRLLSFFGPHGSLSKGKGIFGRVRRRKGNLAYFSLARAHACARIPFPFPFEGLPLGLPFFLDSLRCRCHLYVFFVPPYHRTKRTDKSKYT